MTPKVAGVCAGLGVGACLFGLVSCDTSETTVGKPGAGVLGPLSPPGLYGRLVEPSEYPAYTRRMFRAPTWKTFDNRPQLVGGRYLDITKVPSSQLADIPANNADMTGRDWLAGRVFQPNLTFLRGADAAFADRLTHLREIGGYLFNVGGYGPGSELKGGYGQIKITDTQKKSLEDILGERWLGFDLGEQDGRYHNGFAGRQLPAPRDRAIAHRLYREWCDRVIQDQGGRISMLSVLWGWHYPVQDGAMTLIGSESESKFGICSPQVQNAFLRGAGKQYGVLWFGNTALFSAFGVRGWPLGSDGRSVTSPGGGSSLNLMRRLFLTEWLWNSCILSFEGGTISRTKDRKRARVSPLGQVQLDVERLIRKGFTPGVMQTPVAILQDYFSGWMPPRSNCTQFQSFNSLSYTAGDYLTDNLLSLIMPGHEDNGWYFDERGALCPTPYGDIADCLLTDAPAEILARYSLVLVSGVDHDAAGVRDRLDAYCGAGGMVMAVGDDAARLWPEYCGQVTLPVSPGSEIRWKAEPVVEREEREFRLHEAKLPGQAEVLAVCNGHPAVVRIPHHGGVLVLAMAATGMNAVPVPCRPSRNPYSQHGENTGLERPYRLLAHVSRAYDAALRSQRLFTGGDGLTLTTCRRDDGTFVVGLSNPGLESRPFRLTSHIGPVASIHEVPLGDPVDSLPGYWPASYGAHNPVAKPSRQVTGELKGQSILSDDMHIRGGDIRFFEVKLGACLARLRPDLKPPKAPRDRLLRVPDIVTLRERLLAWPRFAYYFDGVALSGQAILDTDPQWLKDHQEWFRRHGVRILVEARDAAAGTLESLSRQLAVAGPGFELLVNGSIPDALRDMLAGAGVKVVMPEAVHLIAAGSVINRGEEGIQVLEGDWRSWDSLYRDIRAAWADPVPGKVAGPGAPAVPPGGKAGSGVHRLIALHGIADPARAVAERPGLLDRFDGLVLGAGWLEGRSRAAIARDREWLESRGLRVVLDFTRLINRFPDLTFNSTVPHMKEESDRRFDAALEKMALLGSRHALICSHEYDPAVHWTPPAGVKAQDSGSLSGDWADQLQGIERLLDKAAALGITVHWVPSLMRPPGTTARHAALVTDLRKRHPNLRIAASTVDEPDAGKLQRGLAAAGDPEFWLLAAPDTSGERTGQRYLPLARFPAGQLKRFFEAARGGTQVFNADYLSWEEVLEDCQRVKGEAL